MRLLRALRLLLLLLILFLVAGVGLLLTPTGTRLALGIAEHYSDGRLQVGQISGTLFGTLTLHQVVFREQAGKPRMLQVARAQLVWQPWQLILHHHLAIQHLELDQPQIWLGAISPSSPGQPSKPGPVQLPALPLPVQLEQLRIQGLRVYQRSGAQIGPIRLALSANAAQQKLHIERLQVAAPQGDVNLHGSMRFTAGLPYQAQLQWHARPPKGPAVAGAGSVQGDIHSIRFKQTTQAPEHVRLQGKASWAQTQPRFDLNAQWTQLTVPLAKQKTWHAGAGHLQVAGTPDDYQIALAVGQVKGPGLPQLAVDARAQGSSKALQLQQLTLKTLGGKLLGTGRVSWAQGPPRFDLNAQWTKLTVPLEKQQTWHAGAGHLQVAGTPDAYRIALAASQVKGPGLPQLTLDARAQGSTKALRLQQLTVKTLGGKLLGTGQVSWAPQLAGHIELQGRDLQPERNWPAWPGRLGFVAKANFSQKHGQLQGRYQLASLSGTLREQKIDGQALLTQNGPQIKLDRLALSAAGDQLQAHGSLSPKLGLQARLNAPQLEPWVPDSHASLSASVGLNGTPQAPQATLKARITSLHEQQKKPLHLDLDADLKVTPNTTGGRSLTGRLGLHIPQQPDNRLQAQIALQTPKANSKLAQAKLRGSVRGHLQLQDILASLVPQLQGSKSQINANLQLNGQLDQPGYSGYLSLEEQKLLVAQAGITLQDMQLRLQGNGGNQATLTGSIQSGKGKISLQGKISPTGNQGPTLQLAVKGQDFLVANLPEARVWINPDLTIKASARGGIALTGKILVPRARLAPPQLAASAASPSSDVVFAGEKSAPPTHPYSGRIKADLLLQIGYPNRALAQSCLNPDIPTPADCPDLSFKGYGLKAMMAGQLRVQQSGTGSPQVNGRLKVLGGQFTSFGTDLSLLPGDMLFTGTPDNPQLNLDAQRSVNSVKVGLRISGTLKQPQTTLYSDPPMGHSDILSYLLFGHSLQGGGSTASSSSLMQSAGYSLAGDLLGRALSKPLGINLSVGANSAGNQGLTIGKYLSPRFYVGYGLDLFNHSVVVKMVYQLTRHLSVQAQGGEASGFDLNYQTRWN